MLEGKEGREYIPLPPEVKKIEGEAEKYQEKKLSPEEEKRFSEILAKAQEVFMTFWDSQGSFNTFASQWHGGDSDTKHRLIETRKLWVEMKKGGEAFETVLTQKMQNMLKEQKVNSTPLFECLHFYQSLGYKDAPVFLGRILGHESVWANYDGSYIHNILRFLEGARDLRSADSVVQFIEHATSDQYQRKSNRDSDLVTATRALRALLGQAKTEEMLRSLAERDETFRGWFEKRKLEVLASRDFHLSPKSEFEAFDPKKEEERLGQFGTEYELLTSMPVPRVVREEAEKEKPFRVDWEGLSWKAWEEGTLINFYGRFTPKLEKPHIVNKETYLPALFAIVQSPHGQSREHYLNFLSGVIPEDFAKYEVPEKVSIEDIWRAAGLAHARAYSLAALDGRAEDAQSEIAAIKDFLRAEIEKAADPKDNAFLSDLFKVIDSSENDLMRVTKMPPSTLPVSADSFMLWHPSLNRAREIPDFRTLLAEKIRWHLANELFHTSKEVAFVTDEAERKISPRQGPSFHSIRNLVLNGHYENLKLYQDVETGDVPVYWEAKESLGEERVKRMVVFGRDGRYFFTALKAGEFGKKGEKEIKYVVITSDIRSGAGEPGEQRERVLQYLRQNGVTLKHAFIDTGYKGTIPEFAIRVLADAEGASLSLDDVNARIKLLSSSHGKRKELVRRGRERERVNINIIEGRPKAYQAPRELIVGEQGKIKPRITPYPISDQLMAWTVEHAVMRNFAPNLHEHVPIELKIPKAELKKLERSDVLFELLKSGVLPVAEGTAPPEEAVGRDLEQRAGERRKRFASFIERHVTDISEEKRAELLEDTIRLYEVSRDIVGPVVKDFASWSLKQVRPGQKLLFLARDGIGSWIASRLLVRQGKFPHLKEDQLRYAWLSRKLVAGEPPEKIKKYLEQEGIADDDEGLAMVDIGVYGAIHHALKRIYPRKKMRSFFLVSDAGSSEIDGYLYDGRRQKEELHKVWSSIVGNPAIHFMEDTFSGFYGTVRKLVEGRGGKIRPELTIPYSREVYLKRLAALSGIVDNVLLGVEKGSEKDRKEVLETYLATTFPKEKAHLMVPHEK